MAGKSAKSRINLADYRTIRDTMGGVGPVKKKRKRQSLTDLQLFLLNEVAPTESRQGSFEGPPHIQIFEPGKPSSLARPHPLAEKHHSIVASHPSAEARLDSSQTGKPSSEAREYSFVSRQPPTEARKPSSHARPHPSTKRLDSMMARHPSAEARQPSSGARHAFSEARQHSIVARIPSSEARPYSSQAGKPSSEAREHSIVARQPIARQPPAPLPPEEELEEPADIVDHGGTTIEHTSSEEESSDEEVKPEPPPVPNPSGLGRWAKEKTVNGAVMAKCPICGKRLTKNYMSKHMVLHSEGPADVYPFVCEKCGKGFNWKSNLKRHTRRKCK